MLIYYGVLEELKQLFTNKTMMNNHVIKKELIVETYLENVDQICVLVLKKILMKLEMLKILFSLIIKTVQLQELDYLQKVQMLMTFIKHLILILQEVLLFLLIMLTLILNNMNIEDH